MYPRYLGRQAGPDRLRLQTAVIKEGLLEQANRRTFRRNREGRTLVSTCRRVFKQIHVCKNASSLFASALYDVERDVDYTRIGVVGSI